MKNFQLILALGLVLLAGCDSIPSRVRERFAAVPPKTRIVEADKHTAYHAAQLALKKVGCTVSRADISEGLVEGFRPIQTSQSSRTSRDALQVTLVIRLTAVGAERTEVALLLHELRTGDFPGGAMDRPLRDHSLYDSYFTALEQVIRDKEIAKIQTK